MRLHYHITNYIKINTKNVFMISTFLLTNISYKKLRSVKVTITKNIRTLKKSGSI